LVTEGVGYQSPNDRTSSHPRVYRSPVLSLEQLDIYVNGVNLEKAKEELINELKIYTEEYIQRSQLFLNAPNRLGHFPYVLRIPKRSGEKSLKSSFKPQKKISGGL
jgi:hypothetical protein